MQDTWKELLKALVSAAVPIFYTLLTGKFPEFPLSTESFLAVILWAVGLSVGGWKLSNFVQIKQGKLDMKKK